MGGGEPGSGFARPYGRDPRFGFHEPQEDLAEKLYLDVQRTIISPADNFAQDGETLPPNGSPVNQATPIDAVGKIDISIASPDNFAATSASTSVLFSDPFLDSSSDRHGLGGYCSSDARIGEGEIFAISQIWGHEDYLENLDPPCPCCGSTRFKYIHRRQPSADTISESYCTSDARIEEGELFAVSRICGHEDLLKNIDTPCPCCGSATLTYIHRRQQSADTISESCHQPCKDGCETSPRCKAYGAEFNEVLKSMERDMQAFKAKYVELFEGIGRDMQALRKALSTEVSNSRKRDMQAIRPKSNEGCIAKDVEECLELCVVLDFVLLLIYQLGPLLGRL